MTRKARGLPDSTPPGGHDASFVTASSALLAFLGWLVGRGTLPWFRRGEESLFGTFSAQARTVLGVWLGTLTAFTLVLPLASVVA